MEQKVAGLTAFEQALSWFEANKKQVALVSGLVVVVGFLGSYYFWSQNQKQISAGEALSDAIAAASPRSGQSASAEAFLKVAAAHSGTSAGSRALLAAGGLLFTQGKYAEAQNEFQKFRRDYPESPFRSQAMLGVAACLDAQAKPEEAARAYKELIDRYPGDIVTPQARFSLAVIYESQGKLKEARELFEEVARSQNFGSIGNEAALKADELRAKMPAVEPAAASALGTSAVVPSPSPSTNQTKP